MAPERESAENQLRELGYNRQQAETKPWVVPAREVLAHDRAGWRGGLKSLRVNECE